MALLVVSWPQYCLFRYHLLHVKKRFLVHRNHADEQKVTSIIASCLGLLCKMDKTNHFTYSHLTRSSKYPGFDQNNLAQKIDLLRNTISLIQGTRPKRLLGNGLRDKVLQIQITSHVSLHQVCNNPTKLLEERLSASLGVVNPPGIVYQR